MTKLSSRVPAAMQEKFDTLSALTDAFCEATLNDEYKAVIRLVLAALCRKRPSPLLKRPGQCLGLRRSTGCGFSQFLV